MTRVPKLNLQGKRERHSQHLIVLLDEQYPLNRHRCITMNDEIIALNMRRQHGNDRKQLIFRQLASERI